MKNKTTTCHFCGLSWAVISQKKRMGCAVCYEVFASRLPVFFSSLSESAESSLPDGRSISIMPRSRLEEELARAVAVEDYEQAAELRDLLNSEHGEGTE